MITIQAGTLLTGGNGNQESVSQTDRLVNSADLVKTIRPLANDLQSKIDLGKGANLYCSYQEKRKGKILYRML